MELRKNRVEKGINKGWNFKLFIEGFSSKDVVVDKRVVFRGGSIEI